MADEKSIIHVPAEDVSLMSLADVPDNVLAQATQAANAIMRVISNKPKPVIFNGEKYLENEDWVALGRMYGITVRMAKEPEYVEFGDVKGFKAEAEAILVSTDQVIGRAYAMCLNDEENWGDRPKYEWQDELDENRQKIWEDRVIKGVKKKLPKSKKVLVGMVKVPLFQLMSMAQCVPLASEILTRSGFRKYDELTIGEEVLAYDIESGMCRWTPLRKVSVFENCPTWRLKSRSLDIRCNADHSWVARKRVMVDWSMVDKMIMVKTKDIKYLSNHSILLSAKAESGDFKALTPDECAVLGWLVCDGTIMKQKYGKVICHIDQSKHPYVSEIRELLTKVGGQAPYESISNPTPRTFPTGRTYATRPSHRFALKASTMRDLLYRAGINSRADLPRLVTQITSECRASMLDAMLKAEGHRTHSGGNRSGRAWVFGQKNPHVLEAFQILCIMEGRALGLSQVDKDGFTRQTLRSNRFISFREIKVSLYGEEDIWCPTTDYGTWVMRQNGQIMITGNTRSSSKVLSTLLKFVPVLAGFKATPAEEIQDDGSEFYHGETSQDRPTRAKRKPASEPAVEQEPPQDPLCITKEQAKELWRIATGIAKFSQDEVRIAISEYKDKNGKPLESTRDMLKTDYEKFISSLPNVKRGQEEPGANG